MFDDIQCLVPLPDGRFPTGTWFQTKSFDPSMNKFSITAEGRLVYHKYRYEPGVQEHPADPSLSLYTSVHEADINMEYHGDVRIYTSTTENEFYEYVARFTHGTLEWIRPYDSKSEMHKT